MFTCKSSISFRRFFNQHFFENCSGRVHAFWQGYTKPYTSTRTSSYVVSVYAHKRHIFLNEWSDKKTVSSVLLSVTVFGKVLWKKNTRWLWLGCVGIYHWVQCVKYMPLRFGFMHRCTIFLLYYLSLNVSYTHILQLMAKLYQCCSKLTEHSLDFFSGKCWHDTLQSRLSKLHLSKKCGLISVHMCFWPISDQIQIVLWKIILKWKTGMMSIFSHKIETCLDTAI